MLRTGSRRLLRIQAAPERTQRIPDAQHLLLLFADAHDRAGGVGVALRGAVVARTSPAWAQKSNVYGRNRLAVARTCQKRQRSHEHDRVFGGGLFRPVQVGGNAGRTMVGELHGVVVWRREAWVRSGLSTHLSR